MRLVVDSNILFTYFWKNSVFGDICKSREVELFSPVYALKELDKYSNEITRKVKIPLTEFKILRKELASQITFIDFVDYSNYFKDVTASWKKKSIEEKEELMGDIDFLATAEMLCCPLWSNDKLLKKQKGIDVLNTKEIIELLS